MSEARSLEDLRRIESKAREVYRRYMDECGRCQGAGYPSQG
ncbi:MAG: hypothetical protein ABR985_05500 [Methanotrichaceae archaeon]